jgi:hypothetical protein
MKRQQGCVAGITKLPADDIDGDGRSRDAAAGCGANEWMAR